MWVTSIPELITITPEPAGGCLVTIELTTRPHHLTTIGLGPLPVPGPNPYADDGQHHPSASDGSAPEGRS